MADYIMINIICKYCTYTLTKSHNYNLDFHWKKERV